MAYLCVLTVKDTTFALAGEHRPQSVDDRIGLLASKTPSSHFPPKADFVFIVHSLTLGLTHPEPKGTLTAEIKRCVWELQQASRATRTSQRTLKISTRRPDRDTSLTKHLFEQQSDAVTLSFVMFTPFFASQLVMFMRISGEPLRLWNMLVSFWVPRWLSFPIVPAFFQERLQMSLGQQEKGRCS